MPYQTEIEPGESITIGDDVVVTLEKKAGKKARLRVVAPRSMDISVDRATPKNPVRPGGLPTDQRKSAIDNSLGDHYAYDHRIKRPKSG